MEKHCLRILAAAALSLALACGSDPPPPAEYPPVEAPPPVVTTEPVVEPVVEEPTPPPPVQLVAGEHTPIEGDTPTLKIKSPAAGKVIRSGDVLVKLEVKNWALTADGPHLHLIVDNEPYIAIRDVSKPINVSALVRDNLGHELAEGSHVIRLFPGRGHHESVKSAGAFASLVFHVKKKSEGFAFDPAAPLLTFSRPKGCVTLGSRVLVDFFVTNAELSTESARVRYTVDGVTGDITTWAPHFIENLPEGEHTLQLTLVNVEGTPIAGPFNDTTRTFSVAKDCNPPAPAATTPAPAAATPAPAATTPAPAAATPAPAAAATPAAQPPAAAPPAASTTPPAAEK